MKLVTAPRDDTIRILTGNGFTLIEMIITVSLILLFTALGIAQYNTYNEKERVRQAFLTLRTDLRLAQTKADSALKPDVCGDTVFDGYQVSITENTYTINAKCGATTSDMTVVYLPNGVTFSPNPEQFVFYPMMRGTSLSAPLSLKLISTNSYELTLTIAPSGAVSVQE